MGWVQLGPPDGYQLPEPGATRAESSMGVTVGGRERCGNIHTSSFVQEEGRKEGR